MKNRIVYLLCMLLCVASGASASVLRDSVKIESLLLHAEKQATGNRMVYFARQLKGIPYGANTLDVEGGEQLVVRLDSVDCVTFVENVLALALCDRYDKRTYADFKKYLQRVRYRDGRIEGYASRLHYFTAWIENNAQLGLVEEKTSCTPGAQKRLFALNFMSKHRDAYVALKDNDDELQKIKEVEAGKTNYAMPYIPKNLLNRCHGCLEIADGDIIALTTSIDGLDVVHTGIAYWKGGCLHLIHASSLKGRVIEDEMSLYEYLKNKKKHTGVRVVRVK